MTNLLEDESTLFQYGEPSEQEYLDFHMSGPNPTSWINYPTEEEPSRLFKFTSMDIDMSLDQKTWTR